MNRYFHQEIYVSTLCPSVSGITPCMPFILDLGQQMERRRWNKGRRMRNEMRDEIWEMRVRGKGTFHIINR